MCVFLSVYSHPLPFPIVREFLASFTVLFAAAAAPETTVGGHQIANSVFYFRLSGPFSPREISRQATTQLLPYPAFLHLLVLFSRGNLLSDVREILGKNYVEYWGAVVEHDFF